MEGALKPIVVNLDDFSSIGMLRKYSVIFVREPLSEIARTEELLDCIDNLSMTGEIPPYDHKIMTLGNGNSYLKIKRKTENGI